MAAAQVPLCEVCFKCGVETPAERKYCDNPDSKIYEQFYFVCPDNKSHPALPEGSKKKNNDFFLMEKEWKKKQALANGAAKLAASAPAAGPPAAPKNPAAPAVAAAGAGANFLQEIAALKQVMLDLLVKTNESLARWPASPPAPEAAARKRPAPETPAERAAHEAMAADMAEAEENEGN